MTHGGPSHLLCHIHSLARELGWPSPEVLIRNEPETSWSHAAELLRTFAGRGSCNLPFSPMVKGDHPSVNRLCCGEGSLFLGRDLRLLGEVSWE